ncbi:DUF4431 domain-containing protein [Teredinibacter purpureus]|uniref:DUF4431 domain-containing protein n=1 Tax=Teredinibacter purpureus TaxID=2731756 RepID=UPI0005F77D40|nr:DUF4431 domain-containing protein [Teredinibacter purpureus]
MKFIALIILIFPSLVLACFPTDGSEVETIGTVVPAVYKTQEMIAHYSALELVEPECFSPDGELSDEEVKIGKVQLVVPEGVEVEVGGKYRVNGNAFHGHTGHHYTKIILSSKNVQKL